MNIKTLPMTPHTVSISIPKDILAAMPLVEFKGEITVVEDSDTARMALMELSREAVVGFDTETRPAFQKGRRFNVSLVQVSTLTHSYLFRINKTGILPELLEFIENDSVIKIGLSLKDDFFVLHKVSEFHPGGFIDLQTFVNDYGIVDASLQKIYGIIFGARISKGQRLSNWEAPQLSEAQQHYAAIDAWACLRIYLHLLQGLFEPEKSPYFVQPDTQNP